MAKCFVVGPIGDRHAPVGSDARNVYEQAIEVLEKVIEAACAQVDVEPTRADSIDAPGEITEQVCRLIRYSDIVIADVTGGNANVMYELGLRHTTGRPTIQIGECGRLPFDVRAIRTIQLSRTDAGLAGC